MAIATKRFKATLGTEDQGSLFFEVPFDVKTVFGKARPPVVVTLNGHAYRSTIAVYDGRYYVPVRKSNRDAAGVAVGDEVSVVLAVDDAPRTVELPDELVQALAKNTRARAAWEKLSYSHQKEHADAIAGAKRADTRAGRVAKALQMILAKAR